MNVLVCVKIEPDLSMLSASDWQAIEEGERECTYVRRQLSGFDQSAAEMALSLTGHDLTLMTVGNEQTTPVLKTLLALDFQRAVRIEPGTADLRFRPDGIAAQIAAFHLQHPQSVIILGPQSSEGQNRQTGFLLAEMLGWPCVTQVGDIQPVDDKNLLRVYRQTEGMRQTLTLCPPVILIAGQGSQARLLRIPTLKQKLSAAGKTLEVLSASLPVGEPAVRLCGLAWKNTRRAGTIIAGKNTPDNVRELFQQHLAQRWNR